MILPRRFFALIMTKCRKLGHGMALSVSFSWHTIPCSKVMLVIVYGVLSVEIQNVRTYLVFYCFCNYRELLVFPVFESRNLELSVDKRFFKFEAIGFHQTTCPLQKSNKFSKSGLSQNWMFSFPDTGLWKIEKKKSKKNIFFSYLL